MGFWEKVGNVSNVGNTDIILFRKTNDYGTQIGKEPILVSKEWFVWKINQEFQYVGELVGENQKAEIGLVINPKSLVHRMKTGKYDLDTYPSF